MRGTKERSFSGKFAGCGAGKTGPGLTSGSERQQLRESIKRGRRGLNRVALIFLEDGRSKALTQSAQRKSAEFTEKSESVDGPVVSA